jgi:histidinol-phosphate aminotransferase
MDYSRRKILAGISAGTLVGSVAPLLPGFWRSNNSSAEARQATIQTDGPIHLDRNESAYGPSPKAIEAMQASFPLANRYPSFDDDFLTEKIAAFHRLKAAQVTLGAGSREVLRMAAATYLSPGKKLVQAAPTFDPIARFTAAQGAGTLAVPLNKRYEHDLDAMLAHIDSATGLIYICNPNNPTGTITPRKDLEGFLRKLPSNTPVVIDEAYCEYVAKSSDYAPFIDSPIDDDRLIVTRTFSKLYGLAGLRVGYAVASQQRSRDLSSKRLQWGVSGLAARAAAAALEDRTFVSMVARRNRDDRQELFNQSNARMLRWIDSQTNFVMLNGGLPSQEIIEHFQKNGILLGPLIPELPKFVRCSLGTPEEMREFWRVWDMLPPHPMAM